VSQEKDGSRSSGPLSGYRIVELAGIGPAPFAAMVLSDLGADVVRIDRANAASPPFGDNDVLYRGRRSVGVDLKSPNGVEIVLRLIEQAHVFLEPFRPGVAERLGLGPDVCHGRNPALVYGRMTGWGQDGPLAQKAGHDINYISVAGALWPMGQDGQPPTPPLNLVGDFGGGGMLLVVGVLSALLEAQRSGEGQVVDAAMVDGAALLMSFVFGMRAIDMWTDRRSANPLDGAAPYYRSYECADGRYISVGAMEPQFYAQLVTLTGLGEQPPLSEQEDPRSWPETVDRLSAIFKTKTRDEWVAAAAPYDACLTPVLGFDEVAAHPHIQARGTFTTVNGAVQPAPAPRFSRTPGAIQRPPAMPGDHTDTVLQEWLDVSAAEVARLREAGALR
jgi:alpha-methylacyl-CoA racemase